MIRFVLLELGMESMDTLKLIVAGMIRYVLVELGIESMDTSLKLNRSWNDKVCSTQLRLFALQRVGVDCVGLGSSLYCISEMQYG